MFSPGKPCNFVLVTRGRKFRPLQTNFSKAKLAGPKQTEVRNFLPGIRTQRLRSTETGADQRLQRLLAGECYLAWQGLNTGEVKKPKNYEFCDFNTGENSYV